MRFSKEELKNIICVLKESDILAEDESLVGRGNQ